MPLSDTLNDIVPQFAHKSNRNTAVDGSTRAFLGTSFNVARDIARHEGSVGAFYRGLPPNLIGNSVSWALYFRWYEQVKAAFAVYHGYPSGAHLGPVETFIASTTASSLTAICTNPIWVVKTRMLSTGAAYPGAYASMTDGFVSIFRSEGFRGFYRGLLPALLGTSHGAIQFVAYEELKHWRGGGDGSIRLTNVDYLLMSGLSKVCAGTITYPAQVVRSRLQTYDAGTRYPSARATVTQIWRREGWRGFYKGLGPNIVRVLPSTCTTFLVYENVRYYLPSLSKRFL
ncbi:MAG: hypothetical protein M1833_005960 [Piccolia ochrophora]|nr:MAG: hypothetical protein M1833_005960 [Piccolia ochrophora]